MDTFTPKKIQIGISACLMGENVRYDGGHKRSVYCTNELSNFFDFQRICPEMAIGMGAPRKTIRQIKTQNAILLQSADGNLDVTEKMQHFSSSKIKELSHLGGYIFCPKSPTCGMERVLEYQQGTNNATKSGIGVFAKALMDEYPELPCEESGRLNDMVIKENFFTRVYAYHDWKSMAHHGLTKHQLIQFHSRYKYLLMAHNPDKYRKLGPLLADLSNDFEYAKNTYFKNFMATLKHHASRKNHTSTLQHIQGYFKKHLSHSQKAELTELIDKYRQGLLPLLVPITLINHYLRQYPNPYIDEQIYLNPHPEALKLRYAY